MNSLSLLVLAPVLAAVPVYFLPGRLRKGLSVILHSLIVLAAVAAFLRVSRAGPILEHLGGWTGHEGILLRMDLPAAVMVGLTSFLFLALLLFNHLKDYVNRLFLLLFVILQSLLTVLFLSNDLFNICIVFEVSAIIIAILIMFKKDSRSVYDGIVYLFVNITAMTFFLFGVGFLYRSFGILDMTGIRDAIISSGSARGLILPFALLMTGIGIKAAILPLFSWLPKAHGTPGAPSIVSALLSGLYVKTGIYIFLRLREVFLPVIDASGYFMVIGFLTAIAGILFALLQKDIKLILAYSTISQIGLIMLGLNHPDPYAQQGALYHILSHAFFKSSLFLAAGMIIEEYRTRNLDSIRGLHRRMPGLSLVLLPAMLGITGAPFFNGSFSKILLKTGLQGGPLEYGLILINLGTALYCVRLLSIFRKGPNRKHAVKTDPYRIAVMSVLACLCLAGGIFGPFAAEFLFGRRVVIGFGLYAQNAVIYLLTLGAAFLIHRLIEPRLDKTDRFLELRLDFNGICVSIAAFFLITLFYLHVTV